MNNQEFDDLSDRPVPEPSVEGHVQSYGSEMLTRAPEGAIVGLVLGSVVGVFTYLVISVGHLSVPGLDLLRADNPLVFLILVLFVSGFLGAAFGAVVGIGTPKIKPHPDQGWVRGWKTFILKVKNKEKHVYMPEFKDRDLHGHGQRG